MLSSLLAEIISSGGFMTAAQVEQLARYDRLRLLLVRCNGCRFLAAAQDIEHLRGIIALSAVDWVRDVSLPCGDFAYKGDFSPRTVNGDYHLPTPAAHTNSRPATYAPIVATSYAYEDCHSDADPGL